MNRLIRPAIIAVLMTFLAFSCAMIAFSTKPSLQQNQPGAALFTQTTSSPPVEEDRSEVGSTDGIILMGGVIVLIVLIPILVQRRSWIPRDES